MFDEYYNIDTQDLMLILISCISLLDTIDVIMDVIF